MGTRQWAEVATVMLAAISVSAALIVTASSTSPTWSTASQFAVFAVMTAALAGSTRIAGLWHWRRVPRTPAVVILLAPAVLYAVPIAFDTLWSFDLWPEPLKVLWAACCIGSIPLATFRWGSPQAIVVSWVGLWVLTGGFAMVAGVDSLLHPSHAVSHGSGIDGMGNNFVTYLMALAWLASAAVVTAVLALVLAIRRRTAAHDPESAYTR